MLNEIQDVSGRQTLKINNKTDAEKRREYADSVVNAASLFKGVAILGWTAFMAFITFRKLDELLQPTIVEWIMLIIGFIVAIYFSMKLNNKLSYFVGRTGDFIEYISISVCIAIVGLVFYFLMA